MKLAFPIRVLCQIDFYRSHLPYRSFGATRAAISEFPIAAGRLDQKTIRKIDFINCCMRSILMQPAGPHTEPDPTSIDYLQPPYSYDLHVVPLEGWGAKVLCNSPPHFLDSNWPSFS